MNDLPISHSKPMKVLLIGDSGVGKTNIILRFCENNFVPTHLTTIGIDFKVKSLDIDGKRETIQIWDTAGQERYRTITHSYYKGAAGILLVYSVEDLNSFKSIETWMKQIVQHSSPSVVKILVGNKSDIDNRMVSKQAGEEAARKHGLTLFETSALDGSNINEIFYSIAGEIQKNRPKDEENLNGDGIAYPLKETKIEKEISANGCSC